MTDATYGKQQVPAGERCTNPGRDDWFTTPCCYADLPGGGIACPDCGAAVECTVEYEPVSVCTVVGEADHD